MNVPYYKQTTNYTCGPAALRMVFEYLGHYATEEELARHLKTNPEIGTVSDHMKIAPVDHGFYCYINKGGSTIMEIQYFLARQLPVIVDFIEPSDDERHFAVVIALDEKHIVLNDPENGEKFTLPVEEFDSRWADGRNRYSRWMMVVSKEPFGLGQEFGPEKSFAKNALSKITQKFSRKIAS